MPSTKQALNAELLELRGIPLDILDIWMTRFLKWLIHSFEGKGYSGPRDKQFLLHPRL